MAATINSNPLDEPKGLSNRREREFLRYAEVVFGLPGWESSDKARSSGDVSLTAFAQLVALRLNAKRALIALYDKSCHYMLAEATRTLSLQHDDVHDEGDALFWGTCKIPRQKGLNSKALDAKPGEAVVIPDLLEDERYASHRHITGPPYLRSYVGVPLRSPSGFPIGTLTIIDDKPRPEGVNQGEIAFMEDVAASIVGHLELARTKTVYQRGIKMVKGLSRFIEGKFPKDRVKTVTDTLQASSKRKRTEDANLSDSEHHSTSSKASKITHGDRPSRTAHFQRRRSAPNAMLVDDTSSALELTAEPVQTEDFAVDGLNSTSNEQVVVGVKETAVDPEAGTMKIDEDIVSKDVGVAFERAASIIQQTMDMAGVLFLHASASAVANLRPPTGNTPENSEGGASTTAGSDDAGSIDDGSKKKKNTAVKMCSPLAAAYQHRKGEVSRMSHLSISERFLKSLMQRFPYGRIWNFSDDELLSSDEHSDSSGPADFVNTGSGVPHTSGTGKRKRLWTDHEKILEIFPGVRSFGIMPMWDNRSKRFFSAAIVWSYNTSRIFSMTDEINYLGAFCDVIMAEVGRLDVQADVQAKTTFISSISHELRSPLHGILGGVECLQELLDPSNGGQMLQMIDTCGRSLLDIINNLLDHAQASSENNTRGYGSKRRKRRNGYQLLPLESINDLAVLTEEVLDSALWSNPEPAPQSKLSDGLSTASNQSSEPLKVVLEIDSKTLAPGGWNFHISAGAWRRILQNLTTNAIKYTDRGGYFKVNLSQSTTQSDNNSNTTIVQLVCSDSGRGMSKEYLNRGLFQEFQQEESNVVGTGLGLSLVRSLVEDMGGIIQVQSVKGAGTTIKMSVPLTPGLPSAEQPPELAEAWRLQGLSFDLVGFDYEAHDSPRAAETTKVLCSSIIKACEELGLQHNESRFSESRPNICLVSEREATSTMETEEKSAHHQSYQAKPCIVLCDSASSSRAFTSARSGWLTQATIVAQPLGPRKLLSALISCINKAPISRSGSEATELPKPVKNPGLTITLKPKPQITRPTLLTPLETLARGPVLLVDDNPVNLSLLQKSMEKLGRPQISATNGLEAVDAYRNALAKSSDITDDDVESPGGSRPKSPPVTIIFMDITMPVMDGLESTRRIRAHERQHKLRPAKIAALTALASPEARQEAFGSGIDLFLTKPIRFKEIQGILEEWDRKFSGG